LHLSYAEGNEWLPPFVSVFDALSEESNIEGIPRMLDFGYLILDLHARSNRYWVFDFGYLIRPTSS
jgi:hypothetical protein